MEKLSKSRSADPVQQALREHKDRWNLAAKEFISRIIAFKQAINGRANSKYNFSASNIKDPLPANVGSFLNELSGNFNQLATEALKILEEQASYSKNRRQPVVVKAEDDASSNELVSLPSLLADKWEIKK